MAWGSVGWWSAVAEASVESQGQGPDGADAERVERLRAWARAWVEQSPPWSERQWKEVNAVLGYRLKKHG
jgi:hypothetical protein